MMSALVWTVYLLSLVPSRPRRSSVHSDSANRPGYEAVICYQDSSVIRREGWFVYLFFGVFWEASPLNSTNVKIKHAGI